MQESSATSYCSCWVCPNEREPCQRPRLAQALLLLQLPGGMQKPGEAAASGCPQHLGDKTPDGEYRKFFFKNSYIFVFFERGRQGIEWGLEASEGKKARDSFRTQGHAIHCEVEVLFPPLVICQTDCYKELQNQEMSDKYRKALKPFVIKQK